VRALAGLASGVGVPSPQETADLLRSASGFVPLLRVHILKEDTILYPLALRLLTGPELDAMDGQFEAFEARLRADGQLDQLSALADRLTARFRPDPARMAEAANLSACGR
jgi:hemerythrin-like domain-containing protein